MVFSFSHFSLWKKYFRRFWSTGLYSWSADASIDTLIGLQRSFWVLWPYGNFGHNSHFGHNGHITISAIMITIARYGCLQKRLDFRNTVLNFKTFWNIFFKKKNEKSWRPYFPPCQNCDYPLKSHDFQMKSGNLNIAPFTPKIFVCVHIAHNNGIKVENK